MNYFFGFDNFLANDIDWFFNLNHLCLILFVAIFIIGLLFLLSAKSEKGKKATKITLACILIILEVGRIIYKLLKHIHGGGSAADFNWWWNISFQMCAIMCWNTIITLFLSAFLKKENKFLQFMYNILFGCGMIGGILTFAYPDCVASNLPILHFENIQTILVHALLIFVPIYFIKSKDFKVEIHQVWKPIAGYVYVGIVSMMASLISGQNFAYALRCDLLEDIGLNISFPWHIILVFAVVYTISLLIYLAFDIVARIKQKKKQRKFQTECSSSKVDGVVSATEFKQVVVKSVPNYLFITANVSAIFVSALMLMCMAPALKNLNGFAGLVCIIPLLYLIVGLVFSEIFAKKSFVLTEKNRNMHIIMTTVLFLIALPVGIAYLVQFIKVSVCNKNKHIDSSSL